MNIENFHIDILRHFSNYYEPSDLLRMCILNKYWFEQVFMHAHWKTIYQEYEKTILYLPSIKISIPDVSLFCRSALKTINGIQSVWNPKLVLEKYNGKSGLISLIVKDPNWTCYSNKKIKKYYKLIPEKPMQNNKRNGR